MTPGAEGIGGGAAGGPAVDLSSALTLEALQPILTNPAFLEKVCGLNVFVKSLHFGWKEERLMFLCNHITFKDMSKILPLQL